MNRREAANGIIMNIAGRDRYDMVLYPAMIAVVMLSYLSVFSLYVLSLLLRYGGDVPLGQMFGAFALLLMGLSMILAVFYLLIARNTNHSGRESSLRKAMIAYVEASSPACGIDTAPNIGKLRQMDVRFDSEERMRNPKVLMIWIVLPVLVGFLIMWAEGIGTYDLPIIVAALLVSLILAAVISPQTTSFASEHDKRTREFTAAFCDACRPFDIRLVPTSRSFKYRSFKQFIILTAITLGFFSIVWVYLVLNNMNKHFMEQWRFEDSLLRTVRDTERTCPVNVRNDAKHGIDENIL